MKISALIHCKSRSSLTLESADILVRGFVANAASTSTEGWSKEKIDGFWTNFGKLSDEDEHDVERWHSQVAAHEGIVKATVKAGEGNDSMVVPPAHTADVSESDDQESDADEAYEDAVDDESVEAEAPRRSGRSKGLSDKFRAAIALLKSEDAD